MILREDAENFLEWCQRKHLASEMNAPSPVETPRVPPPSKSDPQGG
jgi:hypothetical protein